jgi:hypothetical protein
MLKINVNKAKTVSNHPDMKPHPTDTSRWVVTKWLTEPVSWKVYMTLLEAA